MPFAGNRYRWFSHDAFGGEVAPELAALADNMDLSRIPEPTEKDYTRMAEYAQVRKILLGEDE